MAFVIALWLYATQRAICEAMIAAETARLSALGYQIEVTPVTVEFLVRAGYHRTLGARPMRGAVERYLQDAICENLFLGGSGCGELMADSAAEQLWLKPL